MFTVANRVGQLLEIRVKSPFGIDDVMVLFKQIYKSMMREKQVRVIVDARGLRIADPAVIDMVIGMMRQDNPFVERNAFLMHQGALIHLQAERMLRELNVTNRRSFQNRDEAEKWLAEILSVDEKRRLKRFLDETDAA
jgi:hypothetical protein